MAKSAKQIVFGAGNPNAKVVFIGEAPGKNEDLQGLPFVGASGKMLDEMLQSINLKRDDIYITNIVKYRPPENRDPTDQEKNQFLPYLYTQLATINPKVVVTLGRHSTNCFLPDIQISNIHGQMKEIYIKKSKYVDDMQGNVEKRTKAYVEYAEGASQILTKQISTNYIRVVGCASQQDMMVFRIFPMFHPAVAIYNRNRKSELQTDFIKLQTILNSK